MSRKKFMEVADSAGITVNYTEGGVHRRTGEIIAYEMDLDAPKGQAFKSSGCSTDSSLHGNDGETRPDWKALTVALRAIIEEGFEFDTEESDDW